MQHRISSQHQRNHTHARAYAHGRLAEATSVSAHTHRTIYMYDLRRGIPLYIGIGRIATTAALAVADGRSRKDDRSAGSIAGH